MKNRDSNLELIRIISMFLIILIHLCPAIGWNYLGGIMVAVCSVISFLKSNGYKTIATHPEVGSNYNRLQGYKNMGFDESHFIEDYYNKSYYYNRPYIMDEAVYDNLIEWYETAVDSSDAPVFLYAMTIQNHGGYELNSDEHDIVQAQGDYRDDRPLNEMLSCISLSDQAFNDLIEYYRNSPRKVIICMVGDHQALDVKNYIDNTLSEREKALIIRSTPFIIWSNYEIDYSGIPTDGLSMIYVVPTVLNKAGIQLTPYYSYLLDLSQKYPVLSSMDFYMDEFGNYCTYSQEMNEAILNYYYLEYNNLSEDRIDDLFMQIK